MNADLSYLTTTYAREKKIEEFNKPYVPKELAEGNLTSGAVLKTIVEINDRYIKINGRNYEK